MKKNVLITGLIIFLTSVAGYSCKEAKSTKIESEKSEMDSTQDMNLEKATFGGGCFWCTEAAFQRLKGVVKVTPGYAGGTVKNPTYYQVCDGNTGHAEVVKVEYDPEVIKFSDLLEVFKLVHDPTSLNQQGNDVGDRHQAVGDIGKIPYDR